MRRTLHRIALVVALGATVWWVAAGANRGWTKTSITRTALDEVTGLEQVINEKKFVPGVDILGAALVGSGILAGAAFLFRLKPMANR